MKYLIAKTLDFSEEFYSGFLKSLDADTNKYILSKKKQEAQKTSLLALYLLKKGLSQFYGINDYKILRSKKGKPYLKDNEVYFSISHTKDTAAVAFSEKPVGIDVEYLRGYSSAAKRFFNGDENQYALQSDLNFTKIWTLKEAAVKATGQGMIQAKNINFKFFNDKIITDLPNAKIFQEVKDGLIISICEIE